MTTWHSSIIAYEVWNTKRLGLTNQGSSLNVTVWLPTSGDVDEFMEHMIVNRPGFVLGDDLLDTFISRPVAVNARPIDGCYTTDADQQITASSSGYLVDITFANSIQSAVRMFSQDVLVTERISQQSEFLKLDYNQFYWDIKIDGGTATGPCKDYKPLRSPDETPGLLFKSYRVDTLIERINVDKQDVAAALESASTTVNSTSVRFYTWDATHLAETVLANVNNWERAVERYSSDYGSGTASDSYWWWNVSMTFNIRPQGWNTFYRIDETGVGGYAWTRMRVKGKTDCPLFEPYRQAGYVKQFLTTAVS